ncbi:GNAT family N-acetyltransferase [Dokdonia sinensis]|uniref:GNAT family N-acetyltransferase n=1 Tax=Dokdonia sinensis TaxID=2479847 RepID=A0A3M0GNK0_9FLAO|nr:GNAT family N-acetyltransferase [Dokdonia sinensis]RMB63223.1 GNAT family N-acetyltransferase [Dokdonia sinensis]
MKTNLNFKIKPFNALLTSELYALLQLRAEVFVVEQDCVYQDVDGKDQKAIHVLGFKESELVAYTRIFNAGDYFDKASIGRVVVKESERKHKYGYDVMQASIDYIEETLEEKSIEISAQTYLDIFYRNLGFKPVGEGYLEDGIPHIRMIREKK